MKKARKIISYIIMIIAIIVCVIIYKKYLYVYDDYREKQFEKADYEC